MNNSSISKVDPNGDLFWAAAGIGALVNIASQGLQGNINGFGDFIGAGLVGAASGAVGAGMTAGISSSLAGGSFSAGFSGSTSVASTGFLSGAASGAGGGLSGGFISGFGNSLLAGNNIGSALKSGLVQGGLGAGLGGLAGGISGGIHASNNDWDFWTGKGQFDLSSGYGAHNVPAELKNITGKYAGKFEGVNIYESSKLGEGYGSGGITLPGRGIVVGKHAFSKGVDMGLVRHEFGHILQAREIGIGRFYSLVGGPSLQSAALNPSQHRTFWTETWANHLSYNYFGKPSYWNLARFPVKNLSLFKRVMIYPKPSLHSISRFL